MNEAIGLVALIIWFVFFKRASRVPALWAERNRVPQTARVFLAGACIFTEDAIRKVAPIASAPPVLYAVGQMTDNVASWTWFGIVLSTGFIWTEARINLPVLVPALAAPTGATAGTSEDRPSRYRRLVTWLNASPLRTIAVRGFGSWWIAAAVCARFGWWDTVISHIVWSALGAVALVAMLAWFRRMSR